ncbi:hypothetical protein D3C71_1947390 [compost metagenome]
MLLLLGNIIGQSDNSNQSFSTLSLIIYFQRPNKLGQRWKPRSHQLGNPQILCGLLYCPDYSLQLFRRWIS